MDDPPGLFSYKPLAQTGLAGLRQDVEEDSAEIEDLAEIRARVFHEREEGENDQGTAELQHRYQVDLNEETNVAALEDPGLQDHIRAAHRRLPNTSRPFSACPISKTSGPDT